MCPRSMGEENVTTDCEYIYFHVLFVRLHVFSFFKPIVRGHMGITVFVVGTAVGFHARLPPRESRDQTQATKHGGERLYLLSHVLGLCLLPL